MRYIRICTGAARSDVNSEVPVTRRLTGLQPRLAFVGGGDVGKGKKLNFETACQPICLSVILVIRSLAATVS